MTKAQRDLIEIQGRQSELRSRLAVLAGMDTRTTDEESELTTVETKLSGCEPELRAALVAAAAEDDSARTVQTTDAEGRERLELRAKTGLADFLRAAAQAPVRIAGSFEVRVEDLAVMPSLESALSESMQGSLSNELDESTFNGAAGELNGLFTQAINVTAAAVDGAAPSFARRVSRGSGGDFRPICTWPMGTVGMDMRGNLPPIGLPSPATRANSPVTAPSHCSTICGSTFGLDSRE